MANDLIDGTLKDWPVSLMIERDAGGASFAAHCSAYTNEDDESASEEIKTLCSDISDACDGLKPAAALNKAKAMGFVPDEDQSA